MSKVPTFVRESLREAKREQLKSLNISGFEGGYYSFDQRISKIPSTLFSLPQLEELNLSNNSLTTISTAISALRNLTSLNLSNNKLLTFPDAITQLHNLRTLDLRGNQLKTISNSISQLQNLQSLNLSNNELTAIPEAVFELKNLEELILEGNYLTDLPAAISELKHLRILNLGSNRFIAIPDVIYELSWLKKLFLDNKRSYGYGEYYRYREDDQSDSGQGTQGNSIEQLSPQILLLDNLEVLDLRGNPIVIPPPEIAGRGINAIRSYFKGIESEGRDYLYEAKLLIVGEGGAGKTTLAKKIVNENYRVDEEEKSTEGIEVFQWKFNLENGQLFRVNIWDFGGQEIYHSTHQFFLTKRSLYVLVADTRKEDTDFYYWLNIVELLSNNSPLLIIKNEKQDRHREINDRHLRGQFTNLKETLETNLATNREFPQVLSTIRHYIRGLPHIGTALPKSWVKVRETLERDPRNYIELSEYLGICQQNGFTALRDKMQLSGYLHDLGVCLHFQEDPLLKKLVILKPKWGTDAVYKVLDNQSVIEKLGEFDRDDLDKIWHEDEYINMQDELLQLMINFKLCYKIPEIDLYIAPQLLTENQPAYEWNKNNNLILRYTYEFMPKGIITQFIVATHRMITKQKLTWKSGLILQKDGAIAEVIEHYDKREIRIRVSGKNKKEMMTIVTYELDKIHGSYDRLKFNKLIPCNCEQCSSSQEPYFYSFDILKKFLGDEQKEIQCQRSYSMVRVRGLIDDVIDEIQLYKEMKERNDYVFHGDIDKVIIHQGAIAMRKERERKVTTRSAWANGSFYLFTFVIVIAGLGVLANTVPLYVLPLILIAGILFVPIIGALQLKQDDRLTEKPFLELMKMAIAQLPLIGRIAKQALNKQD